MSTVTQMPSSLDHGRTAAQVQQQPTPAAARVSVVGSVRCDVCVCVSWTPANVDDAHPRESHTQHAVAMCAIVVTCAARSTPPSRHVGGVQGCACIHEHHLADPTRRSPAVMCKPPMRRTSRQPLPHVAVTQKRRRVAPAQRERASEQLQRRRVCMRARSCGPSGRPIAVVSRRNVHTVHAPGPRVSRSCASRSRKKNGGVHMHTRACRVTPRSGLRHGDRVNRGS